jgi:opacity protein-like surface antigen
MPRRAVALVAAAVFLLVSPRPGRAVDESAGDERLGVRVGGIVSFDGLNDLYGDGWDLTLFFTERLQSRLLLDIRLGAIYLGDLKDEDLDDALTNTPGVQGAMRILYFSVGPLLGYSLGSTYTGYGSLGVGVYSVSMQFESAITAFDFSDQHIGFSGGLGLSRRLSTNWCAEANCTVHYSLIQEESNDLYYAFTDGAEAPLLVGIAVGLTVDLR